MSEEKTLHLILKKKWFDMIESGEKKEEYREIKPFWVVRLVNIGTSDDFFCPRAKHINETCESLKRNEWEPDQSFRNFTHVYFQHGYIKHPRNMTFKLEGIVISEGKPEWGAVSGTKYFTIKLGERCA